jgi:hypothetical protein
MQAKPGDLFMNGSGNLFLVIEVFTEPYEKMQVLYLSEFDATNGSHKPHTMLVTVADYVKWLTLSCTFVTNMSEALGTTAIVNEFAAMLGRRVHTITNTLPLVLRKK